MTDSERRVLADRIAAVAAGPDRGGYAMYLSHREVQVLMEMLGDSHSKITGGRDGRE